MALPYEMPKLAVTAVIEADGDFAQRLDRAIARSMRVIEARPTAQPPPVQSDPRLPVAQTDRRYRR